ncbi:MAG: SGNH/GDSL hydrolase family protein [Spirochaetaceae bacterium]|jgi:hypothetical protein|nr:SGNH/GDSL hydrolase family protein [Spirochaetaceae bacterium]
MSDKKSYNEYISNLGGNSKEYHLKNVDILPGSPLQGMNVCFLGSSVTLGHASLGDSFVEYISKRNSCYYEKLAISGTTLVNNGPFSYSARISNPGIIPKNSLFDLFVVQLSTNDARTEQPFGSIKGPDYSSNEYDQNTIAGAIEFIISYIKQVFKCPIVFFTNTKYENYEYETMVNGLLQIQKLWNIGVIDLWNNNDLNKALKDDYDLYMADDVHPTQAGYLKLWTPIMEQYLYQFIQTI